MSEIITAKEFLEKHKDDGKTVIPKFPMGMSKFDEAMDGGLRPGEFVVLSGQPGMGKSEFARTWTKSLIDKGVRVCWFTYEEPEMYFIEKSPTTDFYLPESLEEDRVEWVIEHMQKAKEKGVSVVFIDNFDYLTPPSVQKNVQFNSSNYYGACVQELQEWGKNNGMCIVLIVHVIKMTGSKLNDVPTRNDIADTRKLITLPNYIIFVQRERDKDKQFTDTTLLYFDKSRRTGIHPKISLLYNRHDKVLEEETLDHWIDEGQSKLKF